MGNEPRKVVSIARSLHQHGVRCIVALGPCKLLTVSSRAISAVVQFQGDITEAAQLLCMLAESEGASWVVPTSDASLNIISARYAELSRLCAVGCPPPEIVNRVLDKSLTLEIAARCGVPVPGSVGIGDMESLDALLPSLAFPIIAKPGDKSRPGRYEFKTRSFATADELRNNFRDQPHFGEGLLFQSYCPGEGVGIELLMVDSAPVAAFQHRRLSEFPPSGGVAVVAISEPVDSRLLDYSVRLLNGIGWEGVAMVEFRYDAATGQAALMEVNGRFWGSLPLALKAGMNFPVYAWEVGQQRVPIIPANYRVGMRVRWTAGSLKRLAFAFISGPERIPFSAAFGQFLADFRPGTRSAMWAWRDPLPAVQEVSSVLGRWMRAGIKSMIRALLPMGMFSIAKSARNLPRNRRGLYIRRRLARACGVEKSISLPREIHSVVFVCHGNIMRSASAAQFLRNDLREAGIDDVRVTSAGTHARDGKVADPRVQRATAAMGVALDQHRATRLTEEIVDANDVIFAMDEFNFANIAVEFPRSHAKLVLLGGMDSSGIYRPHEIADPYLTGQEQVAATIEMVRRDVLNLSALLQRQHRDSQRAQ